MSAIPENPGRTPEDPTHLERLRNLVEDAIADGELTPEEMSSIRDALMADGQLTLEEVELVRDILREKLGDAPLKFNIG